MSFSSSRVLVLLSYRSKAPCGCLHIGVCECAGRAFNLKSYTRTCLARSWFWYGLLAESFVPRPVESNGSVVSTVTKNDEFTPVIQRSSSPVQSRSRSLKPFAHHSVHKGGTENILPKLLLLQQFKRAESGAWISRSEPSALQQQLTR